VAVPSASILPRAVAAFIICHEARLGGSVNVIALTRYTTGYYTEVQEMRRHERSIYYRVPRLTKLMW